MLQTFTVIASNPSNEGKTHVWKLAIEALVKVFGIEKNVKRTYYIGGMPEPAKVGDQFKEDMDKFNIVQRPFEHPESGEILSLNWLHAKI